MVNNDLRHRRCHGLHLFPGREDLSDFVLSGKLYFTYFKRKEQIAFIYLLLKLIAMDCSEIHLFYKENLNTIWLVWKIGAI